MAIIFIRPLSHRTFELGVRLDTVDHNDVVSSHGIPIDVNRVIGSRHSQVVGLHIALDGTADEFFRNSEVCKNLYLSVCRSSAVAAHGRKNKWPPAKLFQLMDNGPGDDIDICDTTASRGHCNRIAVFHPGTKTQFRYLPNDRRFYVVNFLRIKTLLN